MSSADALWTRPALLQQVLLQRQDGKVTVALRLPTLKTPWQALRVEQWLSALPGTAKVEVDTPARQARVTYDPRGIDLPRLLAACAQAGCQAEPLPRQCLGDARRREADDALKRLIVAGLFGMQAMMFAFVLYVGVIDAVDTSTIELFRWLGLLSATPVVGYAAVPFFRHAWRDLRARRAGIDVPIALAVALIYTGSVIATLRGHGETWFDSACMLVFVLLLGRYLELRARHRHQAGQGADQVLAPLVALRTTPSGEEETVAVAELQAGDCIRVAEGSAVPVDGELLDAHARLDTSTHSGEAAPLTCQRGAEVAAGSISLDGPLRLRVSRAGAASSLARLHALVATARRHAAQLRPAEQRLVHFFILGILLLAAGTAGGWLLVDPSRAFDATIAVMVVACPCAFALAVPATLTRAMAVLARRGVLVQRPQAVLDLARVDVALFDKTGTLTTPGVSTSTPDLRGHLDAARARAIAVALARESSHPLARALLHGTAAASTPATAENVHVRTGYGVRGRVLGQDYWLGRPDTPVATNAAAPALWLGNDAGLVAGFTLQEALRPQAATTLLALRQDGVTIGIASGDENARVQACARQLGVHDWSGRQTPQDKYQQLSHWQGLGHRVLVVGDGSNDSPALAGADVSASLIEATDLARQQTDLVLQHSLDGLVLARHLGQAARRTLYQNRAWGLTWNTLAIPFAAMGMIPPWLAAIGMSASSLLVVLNALRLNLPRAQRPETGAHAPLKESIA